MFKKLCFLFLSLFLVACTSKHSISHGEFINIDVYEDGKIQEAIANSIASQRLTVNSRATSATYNRVVLLVGQVENKQLRTQIAESVAKIPNVKRVYNEIEVTAPLTIVEQGGDAVTTSKVKANILSDVSLRDLPIKVVTENSIVYLLGVVNRSTAKNISEKAKVPNVRKVVMLFEYL